MNDTLMKKSPKKSSPKTARRKREERPMEFNREWTELQAHYDRGNFDWMGLAAQIGMSDDKKEF